jgi:hypothetical protein
MNRSHVRSPLRRPLLDPEEEGLRRRLSAELGDAT